MKDTSVNICFEGGGCVFFLSIGLLAGWVVGWLGCWGWQFGRRRGGGISEGEFHQRNFVGEFHRSEVPIFDGRQMGTVLVFNTILKSVVTRESKHLLICHVCHVLTS